MKKFSLYLILFCMVASGVFFGASSLYAERVVIVPRHQNYYYYAPNYPAPYPPYPYYDGYTPYQPDNGPMRGPNSIEGHKSFQEQNRDRSDSW